MNNVILLICLALYAVSWPSIRLFKISIIVAIVQ